MPVSRQHQLVCMALSYLIANLEDAISTMEVPNNPASAACDGDTFADPTEAELQDLLWSYPGSVVAPEMWDTTVPPVPPGDREVFNDNAAHLFVDVPDGWATISCRQSDGRQVTFAFVPQGKGRPAQCVDVSLHGHPWRHMVFEGDPKLVSVIWEDNAN